MSVGDSITLSKIARRLNLASGSKHLPYLFFMTDSMRTPNPLATAERLPRGAAVILRHYDAPDRLDLAIRLKAVCRARGLKLIIAEDARLAHSINADGLHLPERALKRPSLLQYQWQYLEKRLLTAAVHSPHSIRLAMGFRADLVIASPVFPTESHPNCNVIGPLGLARFCRLSKLPVIALGGLNGLTAAALAGTSCSGIAAIGGVVK